MAILFSSFGIGYVHLTALINHFKLEKLLAGKEKLEAANITLPYDNFVKCF